MADVSVKMGVTGLSQFKKSISEAKGEVKLLDAQLETNEKELKANGDAEVYMTNKAGLLKKQLEAQRKVVANTNRALQEMKDKGISPNSKEFQNMETNLAKAMGKMADIKSELNAVQTNAGGATKEAKNMNTELKNIGKGVAFENVTNGLKTITEKLESGARAAVNMGKKIVSSVRDSTGWADDVLTRATQYGVDAETVQRMDNVARFIDTDVDTILAARGRLAKNSGKVEELFGLKTDGMSLEDQFWAVGEAIQGMTDDVEREQAAQAVFGRGWKELVPLFAAGREEYSQLMEEQNVLTNEQIQKLGEADDEFQKMELEIQRLKNEFWAENADTIIDMLQWLIDNKDAVLTALTVIGGGFAALKVGELALNIKKVIDGFNVIKGMGGGGTGAGAAADAGTTAGKSGGLWAGLKSVGAWILDGLGISGAGLAGGTIGAGAMFYGITELVNYVNGIAQKAREVETDVNRYAGFTEGPQANYAWGGLDNRATLETYVNALLKTTGGATGSNSPEALMRGLAASLGGDLMSAFNYTNRKGEARNKLTDMLSMDDQNAAFAAMMMHAAGIDTDEYGKYLELKQKGSFGQEWGLTTLSDFFKASGNYQNGRWTIPGFEGTSGTMPVINGMPLANMSGYVMTSEANKPKWLNNNLWWNGYGADYSDRESEWGNTWDPSELTTKTDDLETSFNGLNEKVPVTDESIEHLGEKSVEAEGHVGEFGERAGGAEGPVTDLGTAAASAASALASIKVPIFLANPHANGIPYVPFDGYGAILHKGERVVPAREAAGSRSYNSNLYIESMYMNNGTDAEGLAAAMAAAQRRTMSGYGS